MSFALVLIPTLCYLGTSVNEAIRGNWQNAIIFFGYALANVGFLWAFLR